MEKRIWLKHELTTKQGDFQKARSQYQKTRHNGEQNQASAQLKSSEHSEDI